MSAKRIAITEISFYLLLAALFTWTFNRSIIASLTTLPDFAYSENSLIWNSYFFCLITLIAFGVSRYLFAILFPTLLTACTAVNYIEQHYGITIDANFIASLLETNIAQRIDIWTQEFLLCVTASAIIGIVISYILNKLLQGHTLFVFQFCRTILLLSAISLVWQYSTTDNRFTFYPLRLITPIESYLEKKRALYQTLERKNDITLPDLNMDKANKNLIAVLIIGESANPQHMQMNGYSIGNTPNMTHMGNTFSFKHMRACKTMKQSSIPCILTRATAFNNKAAQEELSLISLFKKQGFKTTWVGQSDIFGSQQAPTTAISLEAENRNYRNDIDSTYEKADDSLIIPTIKQLLAIKSPHLVVIDSRGNSWPYHKRYPLEYRQFSPDCRSSTPKNCTKETIMNSYSNSIAYTDSFISQIIKGIKKQNAIVLYTSNHGEALNSKLSLSEKRKKTRQVPLFLWHSDTFAKKNPQAIKNLHKNKNQRLSHANIFHSLLHCASINGDLIMHKKSICGSMPMPTRKPTKSKLWQHYLSVASKTEDNIYGIMLEAEIIAEQGIYLTRTNSRLDGFLAEQSNNHRYWIHINNLNKQNAVETTQRLSLIAKSLNISQSITVSAPNIEGLKIMQTENSTITTVLDISEFPSHSEELKNSLFSEIQASNITHFALRKQTVTRTIVDKFIDYPLYSWFSNDSDDISKLEQLGINMVVMDPSLPDQPEEN